ncbi:DNA mismatch repair endonuclease MutL [Paenibacillus mucilaginosus]|uniref:DNA mismatch repair endonuclease MutL n=1 Tax=Paenibacillus mucilaginosus TaxID=61624 RepID=UPI00240D979E|nr:DNA mismatch repair endonuclease MutL [Paenibacillus mucilaginosus]WFA18651.1 DNA mismatch repair endonuclease MutL [Paenibacillus mucilaginosus]
MGKITILDEHIANQIAAGEVVERPSSVVKELVENAVDAGSTRVDVSIEEGGLQLIRVTDNGGGIEEDDVEAAFFRHATSKIATSQDLFSIRTLGFRGEALPSIAAVSKVECLTSAGSTGLGTRLRIEGGTVRLKEDAAAQRGTDLSVRELFYNTPARLKYMKTVQTELGHVTDYMYRLALAYPNIAFTLKHNGHVLLQTLGSGDLLQAVAAVYGSSLAKSMLKIEGETLDYKLEGLISKPELTRANRGGITTVINGRYIRSFPVNQALLQGYHTLLPIGRFPVAVLHLTMDPTLVDVNVHPAKLEVRFSKEPELIALIENAVRETLGRQRLIPQGGAPAAPARVREQLVQEQLELYRPQAASAAEPARVREQLVQEQLELYRPQAASAAEPAAVPPAAVRSEAPAASPGGSPFGGGPRGAGAPAPAAQPQAQAPWAPPARADGPAASAPRLREAGAAYAERPAPAGGRAMPARPPRPAERCCARWRRRKRPPPALPAFPKLTPIGQLHGTYIVAQNEEGLFLVDQHAAHERINYEHYFDLFGRPAEASQELLVPMTLEYTSVEALRLTEKLPQLEQAGVYLEPFGGTSFLVRAYPHWLPKGEEQAIVEEMIDLLLQDKKGIDIAKFREKAAIMCSCKASIKANQSMGTLEIEVLLDRLAACRNPYTCPHGRPIVVSFSTYELEKMFKRVM